MEISSRMMRTLLLLLERPVAGSECVLLRGKVSYRVIDTFRENEQVIDMNILFQARGEECHV